MESKLLKRTKLLIILGIIAAFIWFIVIYPTYKFKQYENIVKEAALKYYDFNQDKLPTGNRVATLKLQTLFTQAYLKDDLFIPYTKKVCSPTNSWVKVTKKDNDYQYYVYLECGAIKSTIDHDGPKIILKGDTNMTVEINSDFEDPGVKKVIDKKDGVLDKEDVVAKSTVDITTPGEYDIKYTAVDKLGNQTTVTRNVNVVNTLKSQVKKLTGKDSIFVGNPNNNNIKISNMYFKIVGLDDNNDVVVVSDFPLAYVNYNKIDDWLNNYYYNLLSDETKKFIVKKSYCKSVSDVNSKECKSKSKEVNIYYPSISEVNNAAKDGENFMRTNELSWINGLSNKILTIGKYNNMFYNNSYSEKQKTDLATIRPMFTIQGNLKVLSGDGTYQKPFTLKDNKKLNGDSKISDLSIGDFIKNKGVYYRIVSIEKDGTAKVITYKNVGKTDEYVKVVYSGKSPYIYNPTKKGNLGFEVNNKMTNYLDKSIFTSHEIEVPIYKNKIIYGSEIETKKYKVLYSIPNIFEIYSAHSFYEDNNNQGTCWFINSSKAENTGVVINGYGEVDYSVYADDPYGVRVIAYIDSDHFIAGGDGSYYNPYKLR